MEKHQLAQELRQRQYVAGLVERRMIDALSDEEIIDCYTTCSCCGEPLVDAPVRKKAMDLALNAEQFFQLCDEMANGQQRTDHGRARKRRPATPQQRRERSQLN
jgi:hypothetical protein